MSKENIITVTKQNSAPASYSSAASLSREMTNESSGLSQALDETWNHELAHFLNDPEKKGIFGYTIRYLITPTRGIIMASWIAYYQPTGEREPEDLMAIAKAPGWGRMSDQDANVYNRAWSDYLKKLDTERFKSEKEGKNGVPITDLIPRIGNENVEEYVKRANLILNIGNILDKWEKVGKIPSLDQVYREDPREFMRQNWGELKKAYNQALINQKSNEGNISKESNSRIPERRI